MNLIFYEFKDLIVDLQISSLVALRDLDGLPGVSNLPYFFFDDVVEVDVSLFEMLDDVKELKLLLVCEDKKDKLRIVLVLNNISLF